MLTNRDTIALMFCLLSSLTLRCSSGEFRRVLGSRVILQGRGRFTPAMLLYYSDNWQLP